VGPALPGDLPTAWLIAKRAAIESLRDRVTFGVSTLWVLVIPIALVLLAVRPEVEPVRRAPTDNPGTLIAIYLLVVGLMPAGGSVGVASGLFAGERENGNLLPLLASPASNRAIFAGKVLGAVLPALLYAALAEGSYLIEVAALLGPSNLTLLPWPFALAMLILVPGDAVLGAAVASLVSSRVRTYQSAQLLASLALYPIMGGLFGLAIAMERWGALALVAVIVALFAIDGLLILFGAATWQREEVMARR
jgi:ABC-type Na+ efflux pump permease subunit